MTVNVLRDTVACVQDASFFADGDKVTDIANKVQVVVCLQSVDGNLSPIGTLWVSIMLKF